MFNWRLAAICILVFVATFALGQEPARSKYDATSFNLKQRAEAYAQFREDFWNAWTSGKQQGFVVRLATLENDVSDLIFDIVTKDGKPMVVFENRAVKHPSERTADAKSTFTDVKKNPLEPIDRGCSRPGCEFKLSFEREGKSPYIF